ncbi:hypothetical protein C5167_015718 [Papaver somniferum]|uniref:Uncharacterized protein n=1 Tax=Papaver somniferum TaxID=3469 RepID=A0A4Y7J9Z7_PAPSO|nr:hypothetical protein C5167_015718 [Papaver somniferum]
MLESTQKPWLQLMVFPCRGLLNLLK